MRCVALVSLNVAPLSLRHAEGSVVEKTRSKSAGSWSDWHAVDGELGVLVCCERGGRGLSRTAHRSAYGGCVMLVVAVCARGIGEGRGQHAG